jgi:hypothetical protein
VATFNKFQDFAEQLGKGVHQLHAAGHTLKVYLSNTTPDAALDAVKADLAEITPANGYPSGGTDVQNDYTETGGTGTLSGVDVVFTASGGSFGPFRYAVLYNDTPTSPCINCSICNRASFYLSYTRWNSNYHFWPWNLW